MAESRIFIPLILGTQRKDRMSEFAARWLFGQMEEREDIESEFVDVRDFDLPRDDYGRTLGSSFPEWRDTMTRADGLVIVTPEYNHGYPGALKSVLDILLAEYAHKAVGLVGVSSTPWGGVRVIESLLPVVRTLGLSVTRGDLYFPKIATKFDESGQLLDAAYVHHAKTFLDELVWMARALKWGRENLHSA